MGRKITRATRPALSEQEEVKLLEQLRAHYESGNILAMHQALHVCNTAKLPPPDWLTSAFKEMFVLSVEG